MKTFGSRGGRAALMLALTVLLCIAMNAASFCIDTDALRQNAAQGLLMLEQEGAAPELVGGYRSARLDNFTAVLIVKTAAYTGPETPLQKAFGGLRTDMPTPDGQDGWSAFCTYADGSASPTGGLSYTRYWHGYTLPLRLLLCLMSLANIQMLLFYAQTALFAAVCALALRRVPALLPGLITSFFLLMPLATGVCLQYAPVTLLALSGCLALLLFDAHIDRATGMPAFFALLGVLTNYFDLLTFPLVALGFPLAVCMALRLCDGRLKARALFLELLACGVCWGLGYAGMWMLKWGLVTLCYGSGPLAGILGQAALRVSSTSNGTQYSRLDALAINLSVLTDKPAYLLVMAATAVLCAALPLRRGVQLRREGQPVRPDARAALLLLPALAPPAWCLLMANHSLDHAFFTYRNLTVSALFGFAALALCVRRDNAA